jgi:hypothetical protein
MIIRSLDPISWYQWMKTFCLKENFDAHIELGEFDGKSKKYYNRESDEEVGTKYLAAHILYSCLEKNT